MTDRHWYAGGTWATNWTFADLHGRAMVVFNAHRKVEITAETRDGHVQTAERPGLRDFLTSRHGRLTPAHFNEASRLPGVCVAGNCSSLTVQIDPERPDLCTCAWAALGKADECGYFPLYAGATEFPEQYANGGLFALWERRTPLLSWQEMERQQEQHRGRVEQQAREQIQSGDAAAARRLLTDLPLAYPVH